MRLSPGRLKFVSFARRGSTSSRRPNCRAIAWASEPLRRITARAPRPLGVDSATIVLIGHHRTNAHKAQTYLFVLVVSSCGGDLLFIFAAGNSQLAIGAFTN